MSRRNFENIVGSYEDDTKEALEANGTEERVRRIRAASTKVRNKMEETEEAVVEQVRSLPQREANELVETFEQGCQCVEQLATDVLEYCLEQIRKLIRAIWDGAKVIFRTARNILYSIFG